MVLLKITSLSLSPFQRFPGGETEEKFMPKILIRVGHQAQKKTENLWSKKQSLGGPLGL
jgi:hypothetical protein